MNLLDLTPRQLTRAAAIKERIAALNRELRNLLATSINGAKRQSGNGMSAAGRRKIAAAQRARWAKLRREKRAKASAPANARKTKAITSANSSRSVKLKAYWAAKRAGKK